MSRYGWQQGYFKRAAHLFYIDAESGGLSLCGRESRTNSELEQDGNRVFSFSMCGHCMKAARKLPSEWVGDLDKLLGR